MKEKILVVEVCISLVYFMWNPEQIYYSFTRCLSGNIEIDFKFKFTLIYVKLHLMVDCGIFSVMLPENVS